MKPDATTLKIITSWVARLVQLTNTPQGLTPQELREKLGAYVVAFGGEFPSAAFTQASAMVVIEGQNWFPSYPLLRDRLAIWWRDNKPASAPAIEDGRPRPAGWEPMDQHWVNYWHTRCAEMSRLECPREAEFQRLRVEGLIRKMSWRAAELLGFAHKPPELSEAQRKEIADNMARFRHDD